MLGKIGDIFYNIAPNFFNLNHLPKHYYKLDDQHKNN
jgi:hypothetical protein